MEPRKSCLLLRNLFPARCAGGFLLQRNRSRRRASFADYSQFSKLRHPSVSIFGLSKERCRISASNLIEAWAMAMKPERRKAFEAALDSLKEDELRALEGLTVVRMEHKDIEMIAHAMGEIVRLKMKERGII
jgi:hypothetical protein